MAVIDEVGGFGKFQLRYSFLFVVPVLFFCGAHTVSMIFVGSAPDRFVNCNAIEKHQKHQKHQKHRGLSESGAYVSDLISALQMKTGVEELFGNPVQQEAPEKESVDEKKPKNKKAPEKESVDEKKPKNKKEAPEKESVDEKKPKNKKEAPEKESVDEKKPKNKKEPPEKESVVSKEKKSKSKGEPVKMDKVSHDKCDRTEIVPDDDCTTPYLYAQPHATVVSEFHLNTCNSKFHRNAAWSNSAYFGGFLIGVFLLGWFSDLFGRKPVGVFSYVLMVAFSTWTIFSRSYIAFCISRFMTGFGIGGVGLIFYVIISEISSGRYRTLVTIVHGIGFALGACYSCLTAMVFHNWRILTASIVIPSLTILALFLTKYNIESPRWNVANMKGKEALLTWRVIAETNEKLLSSSFTEDYVLVDSCEEEKEEEEEEEEILNHSIMKSSNDSLFKIFRLWPLHNWSVVMIVFWFATSLSYYTLFFDLSNIEQELASGLNLLHTRVLPSWDKVVGFPDYVAGYMDKLDSGPAGSFLGSTNVADLNRDFWSEMKRIAFAVFTSFLLEVPVTALALFLSGYRKIGRRGITISSTLLAGLLCLVAFVLIFIRRISHVTVMILVLVARLFSASAFVTLYLFSAELYPTSVRSGAMGVMSMHARVAGIFAPLLSGILEGVFHGCPILICGLISLVAALLGIRVLPETARRPLLSHISATQQFYYRRGYPIDIRLLPCIPCPIFNVASLAETKVLIREDEHTTAQTTPTYAPDSIDNNIVDNPVEETTFHDKARDFSKIIEEATKTAYNKVIGKENDEGTNKYTLFREEDILKDQGESVFDIEK